MLSFGILLIIAVVAVWAIKNACLRLWYRLHTLVGIEVGTSRYALPVQSYQYGLANMMQTKAIVPNSERLRYNQINAEQNTAAQPKKTLSKRPWLKKQDEKIIPLSQFSNINVAQINRMPTEAAILLDQIDAKIEQYRAWQQSSSDDQRVTWANESQFIVDKLIQQTIPDAVNQYDQLARFNPDKLNLNIHDELTAGQILVALLQQVDEQIDDMMLQLQQQTSNELATIYRYVKARKNA